ncbi:hypothetical protein C0J50_11042 [Silurus asotus]|uniref:Uncharacterized protein n=1 Tax=Silurus asotus TaxID=30991 RepID=A0AAD5ADZ8_SILAS|nr:hypothetical protein C0J50_11042 [Silurus asotus]
MAKLEQKKNISTLAFGGKTAEEKEEEEEEDEEVDVSNGLTEPLVTGDVHEPGVRTKPGKRSTESEVYDDGTNTFFWWAPKQGPVLFFFSDLPKSSQRHFVCMKISPIGDGAEDGAPIGGAAEEPRHTKLPLLCP